MSQYAKNITRITYLLLVLGLAMIVAQALMLLIPPAQAATGESAVKFHGNLVVVECAVNDGQDVTVNFGDAVGVHRIDGIRYRRVVPLTVDCKDPTGKNGIPPLTLTLQGTSTEFDNAAVKTNVGGLGIELQRDGQAQELNKPIPLTYGHVPQLSAVPVLKPGTELSAQSFSGGVTLVVEVA